MGKVKMISVCLSIVLIAVVAVVAVVCYQYDDIYLYIHYGTRNLRVKDICMNGRDYDECVSSLSGVKTENWNDIIVITFRLAIEKIQEARKKLALVEKDDKTSKALESCKNFLDIAVDDLQRSLNKLFDPNKTKDSYADVMVWISGAMVYQETCLDGLENTTDGTHDTMKKILNDPSHLTSDLLHFGAADYFNDFGFYSTNKTGLNRRLLESSSLEDVSHRSLFEDNPKADVVVALDGSGQFKTISDAIKSVPPKSNKAFIILVKPGVYKEYVNIPRDTNGVVLIGSGVANTKVTGDKSYAKGGLATFDTPTFAVDGDFFIAKDITFENSAGAEGQQASALRVSGNKAVFYNCRIDGYQNTLYTHAYSQFYRDCTISGTIDFIFGYADVVFQNCKMIVKKPAETDQKQSKVAATVAAQGWFDSADVGGILIHNCIITGEQSLMTDNPPIKSYLGRPWKPYSKTIIVQSFIDKNIAPEGWLMREGDSVDNCNLGEFKNRGPGSNMSKRVTWKGILNITDYNEASVRFVPKSFLLRDDWVKITGCPYEPGMMQDVRLIS